MRLDIAILLLNYFAGEASKAQAVEQHTQDYLEHGPEIADANYMEKYEKERIRNSGISSWLSLSQNHLEPNPPKPPQAHETRSGQSLRRRIAKGVIKGAAKGIGKGVSTFFNELSPPSSTTKGGKNPNQP